MEETIGSKLKSWTRWGAIISLIGPYILNLLLAPGIMSAVEMILASVIGFVLCMGLVKAENIAAIIASASTDKAKLAVEAAKLMRPTSPKPPLS